MNHDILARRQRMRGPPGAQSRQGNDQGSGGAASRSVINHIAARIRSVPRSPPVSGKVIDIPTKLPMEGKRSKTMSNVGKPNKLLNVMVAASPIQDQRCEANQVEYHLTKHTGQERTRS